MKKSDGCPRAPAAGVLLFQICNPKSREPYAEFYDFSTTMHQEQEIYNEQSKQVQKFAASNPPAGLTVAHPSIFPDLSWGVMMHRFNWVFIGRVISVIRNQSGKKCRRSVIQESFELFGGE